MTPEQIVDLLIAKAPALREAGVLHLELEGITADFAAAPPKPSAGPVDDEPDFSDALNDPRSYSNGRVPGFRALIEGLNE